MMTLIARSGFNPHPDRVVLFMDMTLYNVYLCLVASNKQQIHWTKIQRNSQEHWKLLSDLNSSKYEVVNATKRVQIVG